MNPLKTHYKFVKNCKLIISLLGLFIYQSTFSQELENELKKYDLKINSKIENRLQFRLLKRNTNKNGEKNNIKGIVKKTKFNDIRELIQCDCIKRGDTLFVYMTERINYSGFSPILVILKDSTYNAYFNVWSDYDQFNGSHSIKVDTHKSYIVLNNLSFNINDILFGKFKLKSNKVNEFVEEPRIISKGRFICKIKNN